MSARMILGLFLALLPGLANAETDVVARKLEITDWKAVFGRIEARDQIPARSRLGGTLVAIEINEGSQVTAGDIIARIVDEKLALQLDAVDAALASLTAELSNARTELQRGESLLERGVMTVQRLDALRTAVDVIQGRIGTTRAERDVLVQREAEGTVLAPISGTVLSVPVTEGSVVLSGEVVAEIGGGGFFLRLAVPERHAGALTEGDPIRIDGPEGERQGTLAKVYPQIENGRVVADVQVDGLETRFVNARVLVRLPVGVSKAVVAPQAAVSTRMGLDFVTVTDADGVSLSRTVVVGREHQIDSETWIEILSGLTGGETLVIDHE